MDIFRVDYTPGVKLYINRVFITDDDKELMPTYLRFLKGVIDSADLPLNVSREILQSNAVLEKIKKTSVKKVLTELSKMAKKDDENYKKFHAQFGNVLKEGLYSDHENQQKILELLRFDTINSPEQISLTTYVENMKEGQEDIYYITGTNKTILKNSPVLEQFKAKGYDVLLLSDEIDSIVFPMVAKFGETDMMSAALAELENSEDEKKESE
jgi:molecular chaperone HtpG